MINLKKDKKILGCFFNGERIIDILNHKGESMLDFSGTLNYFTNLPTAYGQIGTEEKNALAEEYEKNGFLPTGINPETHLVEVVELKNHPFYIGVQYHPEYKSTVATPHPLFCAFIKATTKD